MGAYSGDGGQAVNASLSGPLGISIDKEGANIYIADKYNNAVRKVDLSTGIITAVAGTGYGANIGRGFNNGRFSGDGGLAVNADLNTPSDVAVDALGNVYILDLNNNRIRKVSSSGGSLTITPNAPMVCSGRSVTLSVSGGSGYAWSPSTGLNTTTGNTVISTPSSTITYTVTSGGGNCASFLQQQVIVTIGGSENPGVITAQQDTICEGTVGVLNLSGNSSDSIQWQSSLTAGNFLNTDVKNTTEYHTTPVSKTTYYRVVVGTGNCKSVSDSIRLFVPPALIAKFGFTLSGRTATFSDSSIGNIVSYNWTFGDGNIGNTKNTTHLYAKDSTYNVCLTIYDGSNCSYTFCKDVSIVTGISTVPRGEGWIIYSSPFGNELKISNQKLNKWVEDIKVYDVLGRLVSIKNISADVVSPLILNISGLSNGLYFLMIETDESSYVQKIIKQ